MATFDTFADTPFQIKREGQEIVVRQARISPTTIRVSWTFPPALTCSMPFAYNGAIVTVDQQPTSLTKLPVDGSMYTADPTADASLHSGSKIGSALVVGAFYNDVLTNYVDIMDAEDNRAFYASVHAVDNVHRYHTDGAHSYSLPYGKEVELAGSGYQMVFIGSKGIFDTTPTGLNPTTTYTFKLTVDGKDIPVLLLGSEAQTYQSMIDTLNNTLALHGSPTISAPLEANHGAYWVNIAAQEVKRYASNGKYDLLPYPTFFTPGDPLLANTGDYWFDTTHNVLNQFDAGWNNVDYYAWPREPRNAYCNDYWYDGSVVRMWNGGTWVVQNSIVSQLDPSLPPIMTCAKYWVNDGKAYQWDEKTCKWVQQASSTTQPVAPESGQLWIDVAAQILYIWSDVDKQWLDVHAVFGGVDPSLAIEPAQGTVWIDSVVGLLYKRDGTSWVKVPFLTGVTKPQSIMDGAHWLNTTQKKWYKMVSGLWTLFQPLQSSVQPNLPVEGAVWYRQQTNTMFVFDGMVWVSTPFSLTSVAPMVGTVWYNPITHLLRTWNGSSWVLTNQVATFSLNELGNIKITSGTTGSKSSICISDIGTLWTSTALTPVPQPQQPLRGTDPMTNVPSYMQLGVGTDGSQDERRALITRIKNALGYPVQTVELTKDQMDQAVDMALEKLRAVSSAPYKRGYFVLELQPRVQKYKLTDETVGYNKITEVLYLYRQTSSFLGTAMGNDVYGQMMVQQLFNMGKFDLLSYHMMSQYTETMQQLFASEIQFNWNEGERLLTIYKDFPRHERVMVDAMIERTEQDLITDRTVRPWIQKYATAQCRYMLAEIRGKFSTLPGAGGNVSLNSADLRSAADKEVMECMEDVDSFVVGGVTEFGLGTTFVIG
jgi:hypothetical protein